MASRPIRALLIEDSGADALLIRRQLDRVGHGEIELEHATRLRDGIRLLEQRAHDVVLLDLSLPDFQGLDTFIEARLMFPSVPLIVLTGTDDERLALRAMQAGAQDYLVKSEVQGNVLVRSIRYAIERHRAEILRSELTRDDKALAIQRLARGVAQLVEAPTSELAADIGAMQQIVTELAEQSRVPAAILSRFEEHRRHALEANRRIQAVTNDLRAFGGVGELRIAPGSINEAIDEACTAVKNETPQLFELVRNLGEVPPVAVDREAIVRALVNLLRHVSTTAPANGSGRRVVISSHADGGAVQIEVTDNGRPIPAVDGETLFEPFSGSRVHAQGSGLGLAICAVIARAHGGNIELDSPPEGGNRFVVTLPREH